MTAAYASPATMSSMDLLRVGRSLRALRLRRDLRQQDVADLAGFSQQLVAKIEAGDVRRVAIGDLELIVRALGADLDMRVRWHGEGLDRLLDEAHANLVDALVRRLTSWGWDCRVEVGFNWYGERGSIDVLASWRADPTRLLVIEIKSVVPDSQAVLGNLDRKARLARRAVDGGPEPANGTLLVIGDSSTSRRRLSELGYLYAAALPDRGSVVRRWLRNPEGPMRGILFLPFTPRDGGRRTMTGRQRVRVARSPQNGPSHHREE